MGVRQGAPIDMLYPLVTLVTTGPWWTLLYPLVRLGSPFNSWTIWTVHVDSISGLVKAWVGIGRF